MFKYVSTYVYAYIHAIGYVHRYGYDCLYAIYMHMSTRIIKLMDVLNMIIGERQILLFTFFLRAPLHMLRAWHPFV